MLGLKEDVDKLSGEQQLWGWSGAAEETMKGIRCAYRASTRSLQRREVVRRRLGYKAHDDSYNTLRGAELGWQADK